jgi:hypothetical protein
VSVHEFSRFCQQNLSGYEFSAFSASVPGLWICGN